MALPEDMVREVLLRLPLKAAVRFRAWRPLLHGPTPNLQQDADPDPRPPLLSLTELKGFLVIAHRHRSQHQPWSRMDLWFLADSEEEIWVREYTIQVELSPRDFCAHPLLVLDERRIVLCARPHGRVIVYDLETGRCRDRDLGVGECVEVGVYRECLLGSGSVVENEIRRS
uniref:F-box associated domain-containing protein n=1 Tax=Oryza brachyantha TaxID=4533 RepID=J3MJ97_ORYBR